MVIVVFLSPRQVSFIDVITPKTHLPMRPISRHNLLILVFSFVLLVFDARMHKYQIN